MIPAPLTLITLSGKCCWWRTSSGVLFDVFQTLEITTEPSPTAEATRFTDLPARHRQQKCQGGKSQTAKPVGRGR